MDSFQCGNATVALHDNVCSFLSAFDFSRNDEGNLIVEISDLGYRFNDLYRALRSKQEF